MKPPSSDLSWSWNVGGLVFPNSLLKENLVFTFLLVFFNNHPSYLLVENLKGKVWRNQKKLSGDKYRYSKNAGQYYFFWIQLGFLSIWSNEYTPSEVKPSLLTLTSEPQKECSSADTLWTWEAYWDWFQTSGLQNDNIIKFVIFQSHKVYNTLLRQPQKNSYTYLKPRC